MNSVLTVVGAVIGAIVMIAVISLLLAFPFKWTWNYVIPYLFDLKTLSVGQAWCLMFVSATLFKTTVATKS